MSIRTVNSRTIRHRRLRAKVVGTATRPRLAVFRSLKHIVVQLIDDTARRTLVAASDREITKAAGKKVTPIDVAKQVGALVADKAKAQGITAVVFDRGGYAYHGRIKAVAEGARTAGLQF